MKKIYLILAAAVGMTVASCTSDEYVGTNNPYGETAANDGSIRFGFNVQGMTRADIYGNEAATLLGNNFYVTGTKGTEAATSPTPTLVFDNYLVHYGINTAGTTTSNTANWEYVGITPGASPCEKYDKLGNYLIGDDHSGQTIKYWDYSANQYDFLAFSTGTFKAKKDKTNPASDEVGVTAMNYGTTLASSGVAYTFYLPSEEALASTYISDITKVLPTNYGKEVNLKFKSLSSKVRVALYETIPGYSVKNVQFYTVDGTTDFTDANKSADAKLISASGIPTKGQIDVIFPHVGSNNSGLADYNIAAANVTPGAGSATYKKFGALTNQLVGKEKDEAAGSVYLGRTLPTATFAGVESKKFYLSVFPVSTPAPLTLRVDYTLVPIDGATETIVVKGAKAVVPATYTTWLPNYAYTYIFKISDNTNGWTGAGAATDKAGLFPITFDAVVAEATDATAEQKTITTVATPSITTYQQGHDITKDEYSKSQTAGKSTTAKDIYVQVMDNKSTPASLKADLNGSNPDSKPRSLLYKVTSTGAAISEATVMDALQSRKTGLDADDVTGRNGITLTKNDNINAAVPSIDNGADDQPISVTDGQAAKIAITATGFTTGTYAYVYDYSDAAKTIVTEYQPINVTEDSPIGTSGQKFASIATASLGSTTTADNEDVDNDYIYFSKTTNGTGTTTYSYVSVAGKTKLPAGLIKVKKTNLTTDVDGATNAVADTFYFDIYITNTGKYAVKIIKVVD